jgi:hypothetical protein
MPVRYTFTDLEELAAFIKQQAIETEQRALGLYQRKLATLQDLKAFQHEASTLLRVSELLRNTTLTGPL